jgi:WD40 repeat protein
MVTNFVAHRSAAGLASEFLSNGKIALSLDYTGVFKEWDVETWQPIRQGSVGHRVLHWGWSGAANLLAVESTDGLCELIPVQDPDKRKRFTVGRQVKSVRLSPDGKTFAAASENGTVEVLDTETLTRRALLRGVLLGYHSLTFSPDGERLGAGSNGQEAIKMWDVHSLEEVATLGGEGSLFTVAAFSPDGNTIGAHNWKGVLHLWTAPSWKEIEAAEKRRATLAP